MKKPTTAAGLVLILVTTTTVNLQDVLAQQGSSGTLRFSEGPTIDKIEPYDERGLATSSYITVTGTLRGGGPGGTLTLTSDTNVFFACIDDETGEHTFTDWIRSNIDPVSATIERGRPQSFEISSDPITEPAEGSDERCQDDETAVLNFVQFIDPILTLETNNGRTLTYTALPSNPD